MQVSSQCYQSNRNSVTHQCPRLARNTPCFVSENKGYGRPLRWGKWTTPLKQTVLAALWNGSIMLGLCPFQSSTLALLLHNRCHLRLLFSFIVSSIPKAHLLFYICPPRWLCWWFFFVFFLMWSTNRQPFMLCGAMKAWLSTCALVCVCVCCVCAARIQVLVVEVLSLPWFADFVWCGWNHGHLGSQLNQCWEWKWISDLGNSTFDNSATSDSYWDPLFTTMRWEGTFWKNVVLLWCVVSILGSNDE